ncbi:hypothetical protein SNEBB_006807 [Seison nebaliae]|nr:hypothetical protein SNEBB_006807 [Seison nebaliae]
MTVSIVRLLEIRGEIQKEIAIFEKLRRNTEDGARDFHKKIAEYIFELELRVEEISIELENVGKFGLDMSNRSKSPTLSEVSSYLPLASPMKIDRINCLQLDKSIQCTGTDQTTQSSSKLTLERNVTKVHIAPEEDGNNMQMRNCQLSNFCNFPHPIQQMLPRPFDYNPLPPPYLNPILSALPSISTGQNYCPYKENQKSNSNVKELRVASRKLEKSLKLVNELILTGTFNNAISPKNEKNISQSFPSRTTAPFNLQYQPNDFMGLLGNKDLEHYKNDFRHQFYMSLNRPDHHSLFDTSIKRLNDSMDFR